jgi:hypothetical protein
VNEAVSHKVSLLITDQWVGYKHLNKGFPQHVTIFKRGVIGTFHNVSKKYLPLYVAEFQFRYNNRHNSDIFGAAIEGV